MCAPSRWQPISGLHDDDVLVNANFNVYTNETGQRPVASPALLATVAERSTAAVPASMRTVGGLPRAALAATRPSASNSMASLASAGSGGGNSARWVPPEAEGEDGLTDLERQWVLGNIPADRVRAYGPSRTHTHTHLYTTTTTHTHNNNNNSRCTHTPQTDRHTHTHTHSYSLRERL
jgi:hypothetical protein